MVNGTELYLLHTWCCTKLHINHSLPFLFNTLCFVACPSDQIMLHVVKPSSLTHICFSIQIIPYGYLPNYLYCNINIKKSWGLIFKREERDLAAATFDTNWRDKLQDSHQETFKQATEWWRQHKQGKVTNPTGWEHEWNGKKVGQRQLYQRWRQMTLLRENIPWTPLLKGLKDYCCLSKMSGGCRLHSRLTTLRYLPTIKQLL